MLQHFHQHSNVEPFLRGPGPSWVPEEDHFRIQAYQFYEELYWNLSDSLRIERGDESVQPIFVPLPMQIVEAVQRYLANNPVIVADPNFGSGTEQQEAVQWWNMFARRERFASKYHANKRYGIIRGDWLWHIYADPSLPPGSRVSVMPIDPAGYFPITNPQNPDERIGAFIVETFHDKDSNENYIRRLKYEKDTASGGPARILVSDQIFEIDDWGHPDMEGDGSTVSLPWHEAYTQKPLPEQIQQLPIYHIPHFVIPNAPFGSSEIRGFERLLRSVNQTITDEELTIALEGLGVYVTNANRPKNAQGEEEPWDIGPGSVVEVDDEDFFKRVNGVNNIEPFQAHARYLQEQMEGAKGLNDAVRGSADVEVAESGVALRLRMEPFLSRVRELETVSSDILTNMLFDLRGWWQAYEGDDFDLGFLENTALLPTFDDPVPDNPHQEFDDTMRMFKEGLIDGQTARERLQNLGYDFPDDVENRLASEAQRQRDITEWRMQREEEEG